MKVSQIILTIVALLYIVAPPIVDFNPSHAVHPEWTPHARFHAVWLVITNCMLGLLAVYLIWRRSHAGGQVIAGVISSIVLGSFFLSALAMPLYDGALSDEGGVAAGPGGLDSNSVLFGVLFLINLVGLFLASRRG
ncbi:MAG: hypothetical protein AAGC77_01825 [Pseudomonadota bacterium]